MPVRTIGREPSRGRGRRGTASLALRDLPATDDSGGRRIGDMSPEATPVVEGPQVNLHYTIHKVSGILCNGVEIKGSDPKLLFQHLQLSCAATV